MKKTMLGKSKYVLRLHEKNSFHYRDNWENAIKQDGCFDYVCLFKKTTEDSEKVCLEYPLNFPEHSYNRDGTRDPLFLYSKINEINFLITTLNKELIESPEIKIYTIKRDHQFFDCVIDESQNNNELMIVELKTTTKCDKSSYTCNSRRPPRYDYAIKVIFNEDLLFNPSIAYAFGLSISANKDTEILFRDIEVDFEYKESGNIFYYNRIPW